MASNVPSIAAGPRPASTVVVLRDGPFGPEVFMVRRHEGTVFMGGAHVFPGGRVDGADRDAEASWCDSIGAAAAQLPDINPDDAVAHHVAAARELFEEAGILLARDRSGGTVSLTGDAHDRFKHYRADVHSGRRTFRSIIEAEQLRLALDAIVHFAHWVTPPGDTRQFDTRFFMARAPSDQTPAHDEAETTHSTWLTPTNAIAQMVSGDIVLPPPTWTTLRELEPFASVDEALAWGRARHVVRRQPQMLLVDGQRVLVLPGDPLYTEAGLPQSLPQSARPIETRFVLVDKRWRAERFGT